MGRVVTGGVLLFNEAIELERLLEWFRNRLSTLKTGVNDFPYDVGPFGVLLLFVEGDSYFYAAVFHDVKAMSDICESLGDYPTMQTMEALMKDSNTHPCSTFAEFDRIDSVSVEAQAKLIQLRCDDTLFSASQCRYRITDVTSSNLARRGGSQFVALWATYHSN